MQNKIMLITYPNSLGENLKDMVNIIEQHLEGVIGGVHILPFYPSSADRGFAPMTYRKVDASFGDWEDIKRLSGKYDLMFDFMINHISRSSVYFQDFLKKKKASSYYDLFIKLSAFYEGQSPSEDEIELIYKRKPKAPFQDVTFTDGSKDQVWCTFDDEQIDLDMNSDCTKEFIKENLRFLCEQGATIIRADAFAYVSKKRNTNCFFVEPEVWDALEYAKNCVAPYNVEILPEIHEHYTIQKKIESKGYPVYDFALPMVVLYTLYSGKNDKLIKWLETCPRNQYTTLDTHDGIGVVDVKDVLTDDEIEYTKETLFAKGANVKRVYNTTQYNNLDIYQINCTYYSALGNRDDAYLLSRAIQFFAPGIPQVYYVGLLAGQNDIELIEKTKNGRDINRHNYSVDEVTAEVDRPVVKALFKLMAFRNTHSAFDGELEIENTPEVGMLALVWRMDGQWARLEADLKAHTFRIEYSDVNDGPCVLMDTLVNVIKG
jgi:sucrose phosphorylase